MIRPSPATDSRSRGRTPKSVTVHPRTSPLANLILKVEWLMASAPTTSPVSVIVPLPKPCFSVAVPRQVVSPTLVRYTRNWNLGGAFAAGAVAGVAFAAGAVAGGAIAAAPASAARPTPPAIARALKGRRASSMTFLPFGRWGAITTPGPSPGARIPAATGTA